jgi:maltose O-acetyltransferase
MRDTDLYRHLLGLAAPWSVGRVKLDVPAQRVDVWVDIPRRRLMALDKVLRRLYHRIFRRDPVKDHIKRGLVVGENFHMLEEVIIDYSHIWHIEIGDDVTLAPRVHILAHDASTKKHLNYIKIGKVKIGNRVFVGAGSIILPGVTIGDDVVIGAGSVVSRDIPDGYVAVGNPAKLICTIDEFLSKKRIEMNIFPCFGEEYTIRKNVTVDMKNEMNHRMNDKIGYII